MKEIHSSALAFLALQGITFCHVIITTACHSDKEKSAKADLTVIFFHQSI